MPTTADLSAKPRSVLGKKVSRLRRAGLVPCNIYGHSVASVPIEVDTAELRHTLRAVGHTGLVRIALDADAPRTVLVREVQRKATTGEFLHVDFQQVSLTERMLVRVPVVLTGRAPANDLGGLVYQSLDHVEVECLPGDIPQHIEVDVGGMETTDAQLHVSDLRVLANVTITTDPTLIIASVTIPAAEQAEEPATGEAEVVAAPVPEA